MPRTTSILGFFISSIIGFLVLTLVWMKVSAWTSYPVATLAQLALGIGAPQWIREVHKTPGRIEVDTRVAVTLTGEYAGKGRAELIAEADTALYGYGLPLYLALLFAARTRHLPSKALAGYLVLLVPQTFSLYLDILKQIIVSGGGPAALGIARWQMEGIALGYQFGSLLLPTLAPVVLWLWVDRVFFASVIVDGWLRRENLRNLD